MAPDNEIKLIFTKHNFFSKAPSHKKKRRFFPRLFAACLPERLPKIEA